MPKINLPFLGIILIFTLFFMYIQVKKRTDNVAADVQKVSESLPNKNARKVGDYPIVPQPKNTRPRPTKEQIDPNNLAMQKARIDYTQRRNKDRDNFYKKHRIYLPHWKGSSYVVRKSAGIDSESLFVIGRKGSFTITATVFENTLPSKVKNLLIDKLNVTSDELKPVAIKIKLDNGFSGQEAFEFEQGNMYNMYLLARNRKTQKTTLIHFRVRNFNRRIEEWLDGVYRKIRAS